MADVKKVIKDLQGNFDGSNENQMKGVQLLKGLATSDEDVANKFMNKLDKATTQISKEVLGKEESVKIITIEEEIAIVQEDGTKVILEAGDKIELLKEASTITLDPNMALLMAQALTEFKKTGLFKRNWTEEEWDFVYERIINML